MRELERKKKSGEPEHCRPSVVVKKIGPHRRTKWSPPSGDQPKSVVEKVGEPSHRRTKWSSPSGDQVESVNLPEFADQKNAVRVEVTAHGSASVCTIQSSAASTGSRHVGV